MHSWLRIKIDHYQVMRSTFILLCVFFAVGCDNAGKPVPQNTGSTTAARSNEKPETAIAHSLENQTPKSDAPSGERSKWSQSGDPIDTSAFDKEIAAAEVAFNKKSADNAAKKTLAEAYFKRAEALTEARQYASALGDYRRALKHDPSKDEAKDWIEKIVMIYDSIKREYPKEGEEPPPLPFKK